MSKIAIENERKQSEALQAAAARSKDYKLTFEPDYAKRTIEDLEKVCYFNMSTATPSKVSAEEMIYREGMRAVLLHIKAMISIKDNISN